MSRLLFSKESISDLDEAYAYIYNNLENPLAASNTINNILKTIDRLKEFPELGPPLTAILGYVSKYRYLVCQNYIAFYRVDINNIYIDRILYRRRDYLRILINQESVD